MYKVEAYARVPQACMVEGMGIREATREFGLHREAVGKMLECSMPSGYGRREPAHLATATAGRVYQFQYSNAPAECY